MPMEHPCQIRERMRRALGNLGRTAGTVYRLDRDSFGGILATRTEIGRVAGYPYSKARAMGNIVIALPGQMDDGDQGEYVMVLYGCKSPKREITAHYDPPASQAGDQLTLDDGRAYQITSVRDMAGAYHVYQVRGL
ncbi:MAG: hypothetical protein RSJ41_02590 [Clostridia bacterium]